MVLVDTSVWVEHFRVREPRLADRLVEAEVLIHPFIIGALACRRLKNRARILADLNALPRSKSGSHDEAMRLIEDRRLWGKGIGWIDVHLLTSALITGCEFWTLDKRLREVARAIGIGPPR